MIRYVKSLCKLNLHLFVQFVVELSLNHLFEFYLRYMFGLRREDDIA